MESMLKQDMEKLKKCKEEKWFGDSRIWLMRKSWKCVDI